MEKYVISLEQAKKLVELGFKSDTVFYWVKSKSEDTGENQWFLTWAVPFVNYIALPAYHVGELGEILKNNAIIFIEYDNPTWNVFRAGALIGKYPTEAQARGQLLIYLLENKLL